MLSLNMSLVYMIINLLIFYFLMKKFLFGPIHRIVEERQQKMEAQFSEAAEANEKAKQAKEQYETALRSAKEEAAGLLEKARTDARDEYNRMVKEAGEESNRLRLEARQSSEREHEKMLQNVQEEVASLAMEAAQQIVYGTVDEETNRELYEQFLKKEGEETWDKN